MLRQTIDCVTGKEFAWNSTIRANGWRVPALDSDNVVAYLHPKRVTYPLLRELNPDKPERKVIAWPQPRTGGTTRFGARRSSAWRLPVAR
jgi:hypothetical protein